MAAGVRYRIRAVACNMPRMEIFYRGAAQEPTLLLDLITWLNGKVIQ